MNGFPQQVDDSAGRGEAQKHERDELGVLEVWLALDGLDTVNKRM